MDLNLDLLSCSYSRTRNKLQFLVQLSGYKMFLLMMDPITHMLRKREEGLTVGSRKE